MADAETEYLLTRAQDEAVAAIRAEHPSAAAAHQRLSLLYSAKAIIGLGDNEESDRAEDEPATLEGEGRKTEIQSRRPCVGGAPRRSQA